MRTKDQRTSRLNMRLTPAELSTIREAAAAAHLSVSAFMLSAALEKAGALHPASTPSS
ncbi:MAG: plasmid mobilization protein [Candidatus Nanopelagicales bacterium]